MKKQLLFSALAFFFWANSLFSQCPPPGYPQIAETCPAAPTICQDLDGYCDVLSSNNIQQAFPGCPANALNNDSWFAFIAGSTQITIEVVPDNCQNPPGSPQGMQGAIYEGSCTGPVMASQCGCVLNPFQLSNTNFIPGQVYYIVFDGCAGDICDFQVNVLSGSTVPIPPADPGPILGQVQVCPGSTTDYTLNIPGGAVYDWVLSPPIGTVSGSPGAPISITWNAPGTAQLCVTASNPCFNNPNQSCITITSQPIPPSTETYDLCIGDCVQCAGTTFCSATPATGTPVTLTSYQGCDSVVNCIINAVVIPPTDLGQETFCAPASFDVCGTTYTQSGIYNTTCTSYQNCDSLVILDLAILDPEVIITQPIPTLGCGASASVTLDGIGSSFPLVPGAQIFFEWAGPGIVGANDDVLVEVNQPGQYCLTMTHERNGVECTDTECVDVMQDNDVPMMPTISGDENPCEGDATIYTVTPNGTPAPDGYTWTTPNGEPFTLTGPTTIEVTWTSVTGGQLCVTADNDCGPSPAACLTINVDGLPDDPVLDGPSTACASNQTETYSVTNSQAGITYNWTANNGASTNGSGSSIDVDFSGATGTVDVCVTAENDCGETQPTCISVDVTPLPLTPVLDGPTSVCSNGGDYDFSVTGPQAGVTFNWTAPASATITGSGANVSIDFDGAVTGQVCVSATNACGTSMQACQNVTVIQAPTAQISGDGSFCEGTTANIDLTITLTGTGPWDVEYTLDGGSPTNLTINTSPFTLTVSQPGTYELTSLTAGGSCDGTVSGTATVTENPSPTAMLSGSGSICDGSGNTAALTIDLTGTAPWEVCWEVDGAAQAPLNIMATPYTLNVGQAQAGAITISCVNDGNDCDGTASGTAQVTVEESPSVSMISTPCDGTNTEFNVIFTVTGGDPATYEVLPNTGTWAGNIYTSGSIPSGDGYSFEVFDANGCDTVLVSDNAVICDCESATGTMSLTPVEICGPEDATGNYDLVGQNLDGDDVTNFVLHSGNGTSIIAPIVGQYALPIGISFLDPPMSFGVTYYLSAVVGNNDGTGMVDLNDPCLAVSQGTPITWFEEPSASLGTGTSICEGDDATLTIGFTGEAPWSLTYDDGSGPQTLNGITDNPYNLVLSPLATTEYCITGMSDVHCPGNASGCSTVTVNTGVSVANISTECNPTATAYVVTFEVSGGDPATYFTTGNPGTIAGGIFTSDEIPTGTGYSIVFDDANGCSPQTVEAAIVVCDCETDAGMMSPDTLSHCSDGPTANANPATGTGLDGDDILQYVLHTGASNTLGTVIATDVVPTNFTFDDVTMDYGTVYYISSVAGNDDGTGTVDMDDPCVSVAPGTPVVFYEVPTASILGGTEICPGDDADLSINLTGDSPWALTINGTVIDNINGTPYIYTVAPAVTTTYDLTLVEDENCMMVLADAQTVTVHVPPTIAAIDEECNPTGTAYTVTIDIIDGDASCYSVTPPNGTLTGSQFVSDEIPQGTGYTFNVTDCHGCPAEVATAPLVDCFCLSMVGDMTAANLSICGNDDAVATYDPTGEFLDGDDVRCYFIHDGSNVPLATNSADPIFNYLPGVMNYGQTYFICAAVGNDNGTGCVDFSDNCTVIGGCAEVVFHEIPTAAISGSGDICEGDNTELTLTLTGAGPWDIVYEDAAGTPFNETANTSPWTVPVSPGASTVYSLVSMSDANCPGTIGGNAIINVNEPPQAVNTSTLCDPTGTFYNVSFEIIGGDATTYSVDPAGTLLAGDFTSDNIPSGDTYTFLVDDGNQCGPFEVSGVFVCNCDTDAGTMADPTIFVEFCVDQTADVTYNGGQVLEPDDVLVFIMHTNSGNSLGTIIATGNSEDFDFAPPMMTGVTYYVSAVAGDDDGTGMVDVNDPCLSVAPGVPVLFNALPTISITGNATICEGEMTTISLTMTGEAPFTATFLQNGTMVTLPSLQNMFNLEVGENVTIELVSVEDDNGCMQNSSESVTVTVNPNVSAGTPTGNLEFCESDPTLLDLGSLLTGADPGGTWTDQSGNTIPGGNLSIASLAPGTGTYTYTVSGLLPCPDDAASFDITILPEPTADAGDDQTLTCDVEEVTVGGTGTSPGLTYEWTNGAGDVVSTEMTFPTDIPGDFTLTVSNAIGCSATDEVEIDQKADEPQVLYTENDVRCFGETNGFVTIDSIGGGLPPYLVSIDGGPFLPDMNFLNLAPGQYNIVVEDNAGCQASFLATIGEPAEVTVEILGDFATNDPIIALGDSTDLDAFSNPPPAQLDTIIWSTGENTPSITVQPVQQTIYSVTIEEDGCRADADLTVFVSKDRPVYIPNAFSPNGDGINDLFLIYAGASVQRVRSFVIFSRWGETVFEHFNFDPRTDNPNEIGWDGNLRGNVMDPAVFTFFAEIEFIDGSVELYEGDVHLVK